MAKNLLKQFIKPCSSEDKTQSKRCWIFFTPQWNNNNNNNNNSIQFSSVPNLLTL